MGIRINRSKVIIYSHLSDQDEIGFVGSSTIIG